MRPDAGKDRIQKPGSGRNSLPAAEKERNNNTGGGGRRRRREKPPEIPPAKALSPWFEKCRLVKHILRKHGYPPDLQESAVQTVLEQAEVLSAKWAA